MGLLEKIEEKFENRKLDKYLQDNDFKLAAKWYEKRGDKYNQARMLIKDLESKDTQYFFYRAQDAITLLFDNTARHQDLQYHDSHVFL